MGYSTNSMVTTLLARAYGQGGAVAVPNSGSRNLPLGKFPAGVQEVLDRLVDQYAEWNSPGSKDVEWCFLVGGPGNGKSEALRMLAGALRIDLPAKTPGDPAPRTVPIDWPSAALEITNGLEIVFINDASIPREGASGPLRPGSLFLDIRDAAQRLVDRATSTIVFGNVNRGILVEEQDALQYVVSNSVPDNIGKAIVGWLASPPEIEDDAAAETLSSEKLQTIVAPASTRPFYGQFCIQFADAESDHNILVHVVFLDALSLLEPTPGTPGRAIDFRSNQPAVADYRPLGNFSHDGLSRNEVAAGDLLAKIADGVNWESGGCVDPTDGTVCIAFDSCPLAQNTLWMRDPTLRERLLDTLRAAEIAAARRLTYRDLLGHASLAILGKPERDWLTGDHPCRWVGNRVQTLVMGDAGSGRAAGDLVDHRIYNNLFPALDPRGFDRARVRQGDTVYGSVSDRLAVANETRARTLAWAFAAIDPARDVEPWQGLRSRVLDAIESLEVVLPAQQVASWQELPAQAQSTIEWTLDKGLRDEIVGELQRAGSGSRDAAARLQLLRKWRSMLLLRQVGLATGQLAFKPALEAWLAEQQHALGDGALSDMGKGVQALILPQGTNEFLLAPFRPRTMDLVMAPPPNTLLVAVPADNLRVAIVPQGDMLVAEVQLLPRRGRGEAEVVASLVIDLAVAREALLHATGRTTSFTEIGDSAFARIERVLASLVGRERLLKLAAEFTDEDGRRFRVVPGISTTTLRVQPS